MPAMNISALVRALALLKIIVESAASLNAVNENYMRPGNMSTAISSANNSFRGIYHKTMPDLSLAVIE